MEAPDDRYFSMSVTSFGPSTMPKTDKNKFQTRKTNETADIEGATRTTTKYERYGNKPAFLQSDVEGSTSKSLIHSRNCRDNALYIDDIEGTRAKIMDRFLFTNRHVDPLDPDYPLPSSQPIQFVEPRFIRDAMDISDIEGTAVKPYFKYATRSINQVGDIIGAQTNWKPRHQ